DRNVTGVQTCALPISKGLRVTCLDAEPRYRAAYEETNRTLGGSVAFVEGPLEAIPLPDATFDAVTCISVLEHTASWIACLPELRSEERRVGKEVRSRV